MTPDPPPDAALRGPLRFLWWLSVSQLGRVASASFFGTVWMVLLTAMPYLLKRAIDDGLRRGDARALAGWSAAVLAVGITNAWCSIMRHRVMTRTRLDASVRTVRAIVAQATRLGAELPRRTSTGEVVTIGLSDVAAVAQALTVAGPGVGGAVAYAVIAVVLISMSPVLGAVVLAGVPTLALVVWPLLRWMQRTAGVYRAHQSKLADRLVDTVAGLRVLAGLGGREAFAARYRVGSAALRAEGYRVGDATSWVRAFGDGLPALFLAVVTWVAARMAVRGTISPGDLVAVYGYATVLAVSVGAFIESSSDFIRASVAGRRVVAFLRLVPPAGDGGPPPAGPAELADPASGVRLAPGRLTALVTAHPAAAVAVVDRLGRFADSDATWGGVRLDDIALRPVRDRVLVADNEAALFAGPLRDVVAGRGDHPDDAVRAALHAAAAGDVLDGLPDGLDSPIASGARNLSGGQRQRVRLARALLADPEVLLAVEPTSAVDAHTEAAMADGLRSARAGRTTLVASTSPLLLDRADTVFFLVDGVVAATGRHAELLAAHPDYRALVLRGAAPDATPVPAPRSGSVDLPAGGAR